MEIVPSSPRREASPPPPPRTPIATPSSPARSPAKVRSAPTSPYTISLGSPYLAAARRDDGDIPLDKEPESITPSPIPAPPSAQALRAFLMTCVAWSATVTTCLGPFFPLYMKEKFNASTTLIGLCFSVLALMQFVTSPFVMPISRRITRLNSLRGGLLISIAGTLIFGLVDRVPGFIIGRIISGVGDAFIDVSSLSFLIQYSPNIRKDIGLLEGASSIGYLIGPLLGGFLFFTVGFRALFLILAAPYVVLLLLLSFVPSLFPPLPSHHHQDAQPLPPSAVNQISSYTASIDASSSSFASAASSDAAALPPLSTRESLLRLGRALCSTPSIPLYILVVMFVSGGIGWLDTSLAEHLGRSLYWWRCFFSSHCVLFIWFFNHSSPCFPPSLPPALSPVLRHNRQHLASFSGAALLSLSLRSSSRSTLPPSLPPFLPPSLPPVLSLGVTTEQAGLLFTVHILTYLLFAFFAAEIAFRVGEWRAIVGGTVVWSAGLLLFGPAPIFHLFKGIGKRGVEGRKVVGLMAGTLAVLGVSETFVFLPFVPLIHSRFQGKLGWSEGETEDVVSSVWACTWGAGQMLGPLVGGWLMDSLPKTVQVGCVIGREVAEGGGEEGVDYALVEMQCRSAFPWTSGLWGGVGLGLALLLFMGVMRSKIKKAWRTYKTGGGGCEDGVGMQEEEEEGAGGEGGREGGRREGRLPYTHLSIIIAPRSSRDEGEEQVEDEGGQSLPPLSLIRRRSSWSLGREEGGEGGREGGCGAGLLGHSMTRRAVRSAAHMKS